MVRRRRRFTRFSSVSSTTSLRSPLKAAGAMSLNVQGVETATVERVETAAVDCGVEAAAVPLAATTSGKVGNSHFPSAIALRNSSASILKRFRGTGVVSRSRERQCGNKEVRTMMVMEQSPRGPIFSVSVAKGCRW